MSSYRDTVLADSPIAYYRLGEASGTTAVDASGNGRNATYSGAGVTYAQAGVIANDTDTSILLNGSTGTITMPVSTEPGGAFTVEGWYQYQTGSSSNFPRFYASAFAQGNQRGI